MAIKRAQLYAWSFGGTQVEDQTDGEISFETTTDEVTTKDSTGNWNEFLVGRKGWSGSVSGIYDSAATEGADESIDNLVSGDTITVLFGTGVVADREWTGTAIIESITLTAGLDGPVNYSISFRGTGAVTAQDVSA